MLKNKLEIVNYDGKYKSSLLETLIALSTHKEKFICKKEQAHLEELQMPTRLVLDNFNDVS